MATIPKASTPLVKICLLLITAINIAAADRRSVLAELYKQAAEQNRPLILVVDNHSKNDVQGHQSHGTKHESDEVPFHYLYPKVTPLKAVNSQLKSANKDTKQNLLKFYLSRLLSQNKDHRIGMNKKVGRSDDRDDYRNQDNRNYYRDEHDQRDRRDWYRERDRNVVQYRDERDRDNRYNKRPADRYYYRPKESREYKVRSKYDNRLEDRDRHDRDRHDRDRYRYEKNRDDRDRLNLYRSEKDRVDRGDTYWQDRNKGRDYRDDRDRYQYQSRQKYQSSRNKDRYSDNYGASVLKNLLRISNDLNCDAKYECKSSCLRMGRMLRQNGDNNNCEDLCDANYECDESREKQGKTNNNNNGNRQDNDCDARDGDSESCGDEKTNGNVSTRGPKDDEHEDECGENGNEFHC